MERDFPKADIESVRKSNVLIMAPATYPLVAALDLRPSMHSSPTITTLKLEETLAPCPQLPGLKIEVDQARINSLELTFSATPKETRPIVTQLVSQNILNHLNEIRTGIEDEMPDHKTFLLFVESFTTFRETQTWIEIYKHITKTQPWPIVVDTDEFIRKQAEWEQDPQGYVSGKNNSQIIWQSQ